MKSPSGRPGHGTGPTPPTAGHAPPRHRNCERIAGTRGGRSRRRWPSGGLKRVASERALPCLELGNTKWPTSGNSRASRRIALVSAVRGTLCTRPDFIRWAGMVQTAVSRSISSQVAKRASLDRTAVCTRKPEAQLGRPSGTGLLNADHGLRQPHGAAGPDSAGWPDAWAILFRSGGRWEHPTSGPGTPPT